jgi:hypothetical protein
MMAERFDAGVLETARREAGLSLDELWLRYFELTGQASLLELEAYLEGVLVPDRLQHDLIAQALNERYLELGMEERVPYDPTVE